MHLTTIDVDVGKGTIVKVDVDVDADGVFSATVGDQTVTADTLNHMRYRLRDALLAVRVEIPFLTLSGRPGIIRGFHAATRDVLVTYEDGEKKSVANYAKVFAGGEIDDATVEKIRTLETEIAEREAVLAEIRARAVPLKDLLTAEIGEDLTDYRRNHEHLAAV